MIPRALNSDKSLPRAIHERPRPLFKRWWLPAVATAIYLAFAAVLAIEGYTFLCAANVILAVLFLLVTWLERVTHKRLKRWEWQQRGRLVWRQDAPQTRAKLDELGQLAREIVSAVAAVDRDLPQPERSARRFGAR